MRGADKALDGRGGTPLEGKLSHEVSTSAALWSRLLGAQKNQNLFIR